MNRVGKFFKTTLMKNLELKELGVQEMNVTEMANVNGGSVIGGIINAIQALVDGLQKNVNLDGIIQDFKTFFTTLKGLLHS